MVPEMISSKPNTQILQSKGCLSPVAGFQLTAEKVMPKKRSSPAPNLMRASMSGLGALNCASTGGGLVSRVFLAEHFGKFIGRLPRAPKLHPSLQGAQILEEGGRVGQPLCGDPDQGQEDQVGQVSMGHGVSWGALPKVALQS